MRNMHKNFTYISLFLVLIAAFGCSQINEEDTNKTTEHKLTYDVNGGSGRSFTKTFYGDEATIYLDWFTKPGYTFAGWNTKKDGSGDKYANKETIKLTTDLTLYAQWIVNTYIVKFDKNADDAIGDTPQDIPATYDKEFELPSNTFTRIGYNFAGWNTKKDGYGDEYANKAKVKNLTTENNATVTLYAQWVERGTHKITYELNGGEHIGTEIEQFKETKDVTLGTAERTGYTFVGWYENEDFSGTAITNWKVGEKTEDVMLYAKWEADEYKITYELNSGTNVSDNPVSYTIETETISLKAPIGHGFTFLGWYKDSEFIEINKVTEIVKGSTGNITLYAKWDFVKIPGVSITGIETWNPISAVFIERRKFDIAAFWMSDHEVTRAEYKEIMGNDPSTAKAYDKAGNELEGIEVNNNPVTDVSWYDALVYCNKRSIKEGLEPCYSVYGYKDPTSVKFVVPDTTNDKIWDAVECDFKANGYRLPTEAEWEWAARGGRQEYIYAGSDYISACAWCNETEKGTREVRTKEANDYGLYDMSGNVFEWCWDWYEERISTDTPDTGTLNNSGWRCIRGGTSYFDEKFCRVARRDPYKPFGREYFIGLRVVRTAQ